MSDHPLDAHARAIGHLCIWWAYLERVVDCLLACLINLDPMSDEARCVTANADFRQKVRMVRTLAFTKIATKKQLNQAWFERLDNALSTSDNGLRNKRNRYVHDSWMADPEVSNAPSAIKVHYRTKIETPQAFKTKLTTKEEAKVADQEIWELVIRIQVATADFSYCLTRLESPESAF